MPHSGKLECLSRNQFHPSLVFVGKARAYPRETHMWLHSKDKLLTLPTHIKQV
jgi:hypothetical protein